MRLSDLISRVRLQIGDPPTPFRTTALGDGQTVWFDLPKQEINTSNLLSVTVITGSSQQVLLDYSTALPWSPTSTYAVNAQVVNNNYFYTALQTNTAHTPAPGGTAYWRDDTAIAFYLNPDVGQVFLGAPVAVNSTLLMVGVAWSLFSDDELARIAIDSVRQHTYATEIEERYLDARGFIDYRETPKSLQNLPAIEEPLVETLTTINCFWALANDAASDANVQTAEGTVIDRSGRYRQIMEQMTALTQRYMDYCGQLNVGMYRMETLQLRRVSRTTGRLVPLFKPQEFDDHRWPVREIPAVDHRNDDVSGIPSPLWNYGGGIY
jgi:hypothetical protein